MFKVGDRVKIVDTDEFSNMGVPIKNGMLAKVVEIRDIKRNTKNEGNSLLKFDDKIGTPQNKFWMAHFEMEVIKGE